jgi:SNF2 family DNA or RNA helicase
MKPGDKVRLKANPARVGILSNEYDGPTHRRRVLVRFFDGEEDFILEGSLEKVDNTTPRPYALIKKGRYGKVKDLRGAITFYRLSGKLANLIYSLNTTNTQFYAYQFKPVLQFLDSPCQGLLIADEVGLGKTIEAGLIWTELRARIDARRLLVLCPAMLREKWRDELHNRFGIKADICDAKELLSRLQENENSSHQKEFAYIASQQGLRPPRKWEDGEQKNPRAVAKLAQYFDNKVFDEPLFNLVIIDEAHYLRNPQTQTHKLGRLLRPICENLLLLSATPIQLRSNDLFYLLNLLDEDAFPYPETFEETLRSNAPIVQLRDRLLQEPLTQKEFLQALQLSFDQRILKDNIQLSYLIENPPSDEELTIYSERSRIADRLDRINPLTKVITRTRKRDVQEMRVIRNAAAIKASMTEIELNFYWAVTNKIRELCESLDISTGFMLTIPQRQMSSCMAAACRRWMEQSISTTIIDETIYEDFGTFDTETNDETKELGTLLTALMEITHEVGNYQELKQNDSKYKLFHDYIVNYWRENPGKKVILFSFYRETLRYLQERLNEDGISTIIVKGGMNKHEAIKEFAKPCGPNILLSTEVTAEGVDLQFSSMLINYDLPWNPMKIEQRIGRIDRIGQQAERILIRNFLYADTIDERVYERLLERLNIFEQALGSIETILGEEIRKLGYELLSHKLSPEEEAERIEQTALAVENLNRTTEALEKDATQLIAHGDYIQNQVKAAQEIGRYVTGEDLYIFVSDYFTSQYEGTRFIQQDTADFLFTVELSIKAKHDLRAFLEEHRLMNKTRILSYDKPKILFENQVINNNYNVEIISQYHPLVRFVSNSLKKKGKAGGYFPVVATEVNSIHLKNMDKGRYVFAISRWSISGARDIEHLEYCAKNIDTGTWLDNTMSETLVNIAGMTGKDWPGATNVLSHNEIAEVYDKCIEKLEKDFETFKGDIERENKDRIHMMINTLTRHKTSQRERLLTRIKAMEESGQERKIRLVPALKGQIKKLETRIEEKISFLREKQVIKSSSGTVTGGIIRIF